MIFETLHTTLMFVIAISLLIAVHEFGHFIVARKLGVRVQKFSIGFGPRLFSRMSRDGEVEYIFAALPLGGYVKMLGENPDEQESVPESDKSRAFGLQKVWVRAAISAAGPFANFIFAILLFTMVGWIGLEVMPPVVGSITPGSLAERSGILMGDRIIRVDNQESRSWNDVEEQLKDAPGGSVDLTILRGGANFQFHLDVPKHQLDSLLIHVSRQVVGFGPGMKIKITGVLPGSPAEKGGLQKGDLILFAAGQPTDSADGFIEQVQKHINRPLLLTILRDGQRVEATVVPQDNGKGQGKIGTELQGEPLVPHEHQSLGLIDGAVYGVTRTWEMTTLTLSVLGKMISSAISPDNLGGPIAIAQMAGKTAELGFVPFLIFLGLISVNLGVLNILPIPVLDGGHLLFLSIEAVRGKPVSPETMGRIQMVGMSLVILLMLFAFYNDLQRLDLHRLLQ